MATLRYVSNDTMLNPATGHHDPVDPYWLAADDDGGYDCTGPTPLDAMAELAHELELALRAACDPEGPVAGPEYPHQDGDATVLGPEVFLSRGKTVICHAGVNYFREDAIAGGGHVLVERPR